MSLTQMDAYLEEELYDALTYSIQNPNGSEFESKKKRIEDIGRELYADGGYWCNGEYVLFNWI